MTTLTDKRRRSTLVLFLAVLWAFAPNPGARAQQAGDARETPLRKVIETIEQETDFRFLYRDALVAGRTVSVDLESADLIGELSDALRPQGLRLDVDAGRRQILLLEDEAPPAQVLTGYVVDAQTGARLPFASVTWTAGDAVRGVATNEAGAFRIEADRLPRGRPGVALTVSYVGYQSREVVVPLPAAAGVAVRLIPRTVFGQEVLVSGSMLSTEVDTAWQHLIQPGLYAPLGESNVLRSLQLLPSVNVTSALSPGLNVRGSRADGFEVLLDGMPIYSQNHFFGLFDAFNDDALQTVGFYYGVSPARFQGPPGGTLSFLTRTGSQTAATGRVGLSNTAVKGTLEGPIAGGQGSWLVSGRHSYLDAVDWFNNGDLVAMGLDVDRIGGRLGPGRLISTEAYEARFFDVHAKLYGETEPGGRLMASGYLGGDRTSQAAERWTAPDGAGPGAPPERRTAETSNAWGNGAASLHYQRLFGSRVFSHLTAGFSGYRSEYAKDDFIYIPPRGTQTPQGPNGPRPFAGPYANENMLTEWKAAEHLDLATVPGGNLAAGLSAHHYTITYEEDSAVRRRYDSRQKSGQLDFYGQYDLTGSEHASLHAGLRTHYFSNGGFFRLSPRIQVRVWPAEGVALHAGFSQNHQFLHRLYVEQASVSDVWVMSTERQPPSRVDHASLGVFVASWPALTFQVEAYWKDFQYLRLHEIGLLRRGLAAESALLVPWLHDNTATANGLEVLARRTFGGLRWTAAYTLSRMEIQHPSLNDGEPFLADWDRRHQLSTMLEGAIGPRWTWHVAWYYGSGTPNDLAATDSAEDAVLPPYHRLDVSLRWGRTLGAVRLEARAGAYNVYDRNNPWYRTPVATVDQTLPPGQRVLEFINVDVYDLGFQPSFDVSLSF